MWYGVILQFLAPILRILWGSGFQATQQYGHVSEIIESCCHLAMILGTGLFLDAWTALVRYLKFCYLHVELQNSWAILGKKSISRLQHLEMKPSWTICRWRRICIPSPSVELERFIFCCPGSFVLSSKYFLDVQLLWNDTEISSAKINKYCWTS